MKGALQQLKFKGSEDINLNIDPEISYFKKIYKRHSNFSMESIEHNITNPAKFGGISLVKLIKQGELISKMYLEIDLPYETNSTARWTNRIGFNIIKKIELIIGNITVERQYGLWLHLWAELTNTYDKKLILSDLVGKKSKSGTISNGLSANEPHKLIIPLNFFFCNYNSALPVIAITKQDIFFKIYFEDKKKCLQTGNINGDIINATLWIDHIFVEKNEALMIAQKDHEYLIEIVTKKIQYLKTDGYNNVDIYLKLPFKELVWAIRKKDLDVDADKFTDFTIGVSNNIDKAEFYQKYNYKGWKVEISTGNYTNSDLQNIKSDFNSLSAVKPYGHIIELYTGDNFTGQVVKITKNNKGLGLFNDKIRSIKIISKKVQTTLYSDIQFTINSKKIFSSNSKDYTYFNYYLPYKYHSGNPDLGINCYPFCIKPESTSPSGSLILKKNEKFQMYINSQKGDLYLFSKFYNIIKIKKNVFSLEYIY
jgi:hypothetical protein